MNIAVAFKNEISRVARKEVREETRTLKKQSAHYRGDIAALKKRVLELERTIKHLGNSKQETPPKKTSAPSSSKVRFSAKGFAAQRKRLGLSAMDLGAILRVSAQSVYHWEQGKSRPRASQMPAISALRKMGKRDAAYKLSVIEA
jgi:DNA-binding transcriptional regulator YiaG